MAYEKENPQKWFSFRQAENNPGIMPKETIRKHGHKYTLSPCLKCGILYYARNDRIGGYCSLSCSAKSRIVSEETKSKISNTLMGHKMPTNVKEALLEANVGKKHSEDHKRKISESQKGKKRPPVTDEWRRKQSEAHKGKPIWNKGIPCSENTKQKLSEAQKGSKCWNWQGGLSTDKNHWKKLWKKYSIQKYALKKRAIGNFSLSEWEIIKKQYKMTCLLCNKNEPEIKLTIDHIIPLTKNGTHAIGNIAPLCQSCNSKKHNTKALFYDLENERYGMVLI